MRGPRPPAVLVFHQQGAAEGARGRHRACAPPAACSTRFPPAGGGRGRMRGKHKKAKRGAAAALVYLLIYKA